jgi:hypothetical protein
MEGGRVGGKEGIRTEEWKEPKERKIVAGREGRKLRK